MKPVNGYWRNWKDKDNDCRSGNGKGKGKIEVHLILFLLGLASAILPIPADSDIAFPSHFPDTTISPAMGKNGLQNDPALPASPSSETPQGAPKLSSANRLRVEMNGHVSQKLQMYQASKKSKKREHLLEGFRKAEAYLAPVKDVFEMVGLPADLSNLAFLESNFNPFAYSRVGAAGIWQFMESTARLFGLEINWWVDERRDPEKSTRAAATYLKQLYRVFRSWPLAIAAYNAGEVKVLEALRRSPKADVWSLRLPRETWHLVSDFMAVSLIVKDPEVYLFPPIQEDSPNYIKVAVDSCTDIRVIARACDISAEQILLLNPELNQGCTPPYRNHYEVRIPMEARYRFWDNFSAIPPEERIVWTRHTVKKGDTLFGISRRYRVPIPIIVQMNHLPSPRSLRIGRNLILPIPEGFRSWAAERPFLKRVGLFPTSKPLASTHLVQKGDTVSTIALHHGVSPTALQRANGLGAQAAIRPGDRLRIPRRPSD